MLFFVGVILFIRYSIKVIMFVWYSSFVRKLSSHVVYFIVEFSMINELDRVLERTI